MKIKNENKKFDGQGSPHKFKEELS